MSVVNETGLKLALSETPKTGFVTSRPIYKNLCESSAADSPELQLFFCSQISDGYQGWNSQNACQNS